MSEFVSQYPLLTKLLILPFYILACALDFFFIIFSILSYSPTPHKSNVQTITVDELNYVVYRYLVETGIISFFISFT